MAIKRYNGTVSEAVQAHIDTVAGISLCGTRVFERRDGEWYFVGGEKS
jgi:hypothetical protein